MKLSRSLSMFLAAFVALVALMLSVPALAQPAGDPSIGGLPLASPAPAFTPIPADADPSALIPLVPLIVAAVERKDYAYAVGLALMILTALGLKFGPSWLPKDYAATGLLALGVLGGLGAALASGVSPYKAVVACVLMSSAAIALWEGVFRHVERLWKKHTSPDAGGGA